jgi:anti-sigma B factor antagonist
MADWRHRYKTQSPDAAANARLAPTGEAHDPGLAPSLHCETLDVDGCVVVTLRGELDLASAPELLRQLQLLLNRPVTSLTLDLADLSFIDSSGLGTLCQVRQDAMDRAIPLDLQRVPPHARRVLEITGLTPLFTIG